MIVIRRRLMPVSVVAAALKASRINSVVAIHNCQVKVFAEPGHRRLVDRCRGEHFHSQGAPMEQRRTLVEVKGLYNDGALIEIDGIAALEELPTIPVR